MQEQWLVAGCDVSLARTLQNFLKGEFNAAETFLSLEQVLHRFHAGQFTLVLIALQSNDELAWQLCRHIRQSSLVPILLIVDSKQEHDIEVALDQGADDFLLMPSSKAELIARIRIMRRRSALPEKVATPEASHVFDDGYLQINLQTRFITIRGNVISLTPIEYKIVACLLRNRGRVLTYNQIIEDVWGWEQDASISALHTYISRLRRKLEFNPNNPMYLRTQYGVGYWFPKDIPNAFKTR